MDTSFNWLQLRGLGALAAIGIFLIYAVFVGWRQKRSTDRRGSPMTEQDPPFPAERTMANGFTRRAA
jgi:hypothetical protein